MQNSRFKHSRGLDSVSADRGILIAAEELRQPRPFNQREAVEWTGIDLTMSRGNIVHFFGHQQ